MTKNRVHYLCIMILCITIVLSGILPAYATTQKQQVVVGYIGYEGFLNANNKNEMKGYAAEYLRKIEDYSNIEFKYIKTTWDKSLKQLDSGKIDMVCTAKQTKEKIDEYDFST
ncbi:MAG: transporter substrate-binding domain-containing protein [Anaerovoracaceae bacterium]